MDLYMRRSMVRTQIIDPEALAREVTDGLKKKLKKYKGKNKSLPCFPQLLPISRSAYDHRLCKCAVSAAHLEKQ